MAQVSKGRLVRNGQFVRNLQNGLRNASVGWDLGIEKKMIICNEVNESAKYFLNPISPAGADYFPSIEGFISCRQATFSNNRLQFCRNFRK